MSSSSFLIKAVPEPELSDWEFSLTLKLHRDLRLLSLKSAPYAFGSNYERESAFPDEIWKSRLQNPDVQLYVGILKPANGVLEKAYEGDWVGHVAVLRESHEDVVTSEIIDNFAHKEEQPKLEEITPSPQVTVAETASPLYTLVGMFVSPSARGEGLGRALIEHSIAYVKEECERHGFGSARVELDVMSGNKAAYNLYQSCGFKVIARNNDPVDTSPEHKLVMFLIVWPGS